jgi:DNA mismatch repair protein MSH5
LAGFLTYVSGLRQPPIALVATHFTEVCDAALVPRVPATQFLTMRVHLPEDDNDINDENNVKGADDDRVVFLYRAVPGVSSRAYSLRCARDAGLPVSVLARCEALEAVDGGVSGGGVVEPDPGVGEGGGSSGTKERRGREGARGVGPWCGVRRGAEGDHGCDGEVT